MEEWKRMETENNSLCLTDLDFSDLETFLKEEMEEEVSSQGEDKKATGGATLPPPPPPCSTSSTTITHKGKDGSFGT